MLVENVSGGLVTHSKAKNNKKQGVDSPCFCVLELNLRTRSISSTDILIAGESGLTGAHLVLTVLVVPIAETLAVYKFNDSIKSKKRDYIIWTPA